MSLRMALGLVLGLLAAFVLEAGASAILAPASVAVAAIDPFGRTAIHLIDQTGLSSGYISGVTDFDAYVAATTATYSNAEMLGGSGGPPYSFTFDFGGAVTIDRIAIWNVSGEASLYEFTLETSVVSDFSVSQTTDVFQMSIFGGAITIDADVFVFAPTIARFARINVVSNAGFGAATVMNEVVFRKAPAGPEPECEDGADNDADGFTDDPADPGCSSPADDSERSASLVCDDGVDNDGNGLFDYPADPVCSSPLDDLELPVPACEDGSDNDRDGLADYPADPGCADPTDDTERSASLICDDAIDNDGDQLADYGLVGGDPGCASPTDPSERSPDWICDNGADDDSDGLTDYPADLGCLATTDSSESTTCSDGIDNDFDGLADYPADPGCADGSSQRENPMCQDGIDNEGDGTLDFDGGASANQGLPLGPPDPKCRQPYDVREAPVCGLGAELVLVLGAMRMRKRGRVAARFL